MRKRIDDGVTIENVRDNWDGVVSMNNPQRFEAIGEASLSLVEALDGLRSGSSQKSSEVGDTPDAFEVNDKNLILYALGGIVLYICKL